MRLLKQLSVAFFVVIVALFVVYQGWRQVTVDNQPPVIQCNEEEIHISISATDADLLAGITARDNRDGDVTDSLVVVSLSKFISEGKRKVEYAAFDSSSNVATYSRTVVYTDYTGPKFKLTEPLRFASYSGHSALDMLAAEDCLDGDISGLIKMRYGNYVDSVTRALEDCHFQVTNSAGDTAQITLTTEILQDEAYRQYYPSLDEYIIYTGVGKSVSYGEHIKGVCMGSRSYSFDQLRGEYTRENVRIDDSQVNLNVPGTYKVTYTLMNETTKLGSVTQFLVVEE